MSKSEWIKVQTFMERSAGQWLSQRRYLYPRSNKLENLSSRLCVTYTVTSELPEEFKTELTWETHSVETEKVVSEGEMLTEGRNGKLYRNVGYMSEDPTVSTIKVIDKDCLVFLTSYSGMDFREEIRLIGEDIRLRQTLGRKAKSNDVFLIGQYYETRIFPSNLN